MPVYYVTWQETVFYEKEIEAESLEAARVLWEADPYADEYHTREYVIDFSSLDLELSSEVDV